jgi:hypothetical protein
MASLVGSDVKASAKLILASSHPTSFILFEPLLPPPLTQLVCLAGMLVLVYCGLLVAALFYL